MKPLFAGLLIGALSLPGAFGHEIMSEIDASKPSAFDIVSAGATTDGRLLTFMMEVAGQAGSVKPVAIGQLAGAKVESYVWPTSLDPAVVGFDPGSGHSVVGDHRPPRLRRHPAVRRRPATAIRPMTAPSGIRIG